MVKNEHLVPNRQKTEETDVSKLSDDKVLIRLAGIKDLAKLRGYKSITYKPMTVSLDIVAMICRIEWIGNFETNFEPIIFESMADATVNNTKSFAQNFLSTIAENRAFVRAVRNFLSIHIVGEDEMPSTASEAKTSGSTSQETEEGPTEFTPHSTLSKFYKSGKITKEQIRDMFPVESAEWKTMKDVPIKFVLEILSKIPKD